MVATRDKTGFREPLETERWDFRGGGLEGGTYTARPEVGSWERGSGVGEEWAASERKPRLTRVAWSLRTAPRAYLVLDHATVCLSHHPNFHPGPGLPRPTLLHSLPASLTPDPYLTAPPLPVGFPTAANDCASRRTGLSGSQ